MCKIEQAITLRQVDVRGNSLKETLIGSKNVAIVEQMYKLFIGTHREY